MGRIVLCIYRVKAFVLPTQFTSLDLIQRFSNSVIRMTLGPPMNGIRRTEHAAYAYFFVRLFRTFTRQKEKQLPIIKSFYSFIYYLTAEVINLNFFGLWTHY